VRSTAVFLGARVAGEGLFISNRLRRYACLLQLLLFVIFFSALSLNWFNYGTVVWGITFGVEVVLAIFCWRWLNQALETAGNRAAMLAHGTWHLMASFAALIVLFLGYVGIVIAAVIGILFIAPLLTHTWVRSAIRWRIDRSAAPPRFPTPSPPRVKPWREGDTYDQPA
jgi:hypothetical protein